MDKFMTKIKEKAAEQIVTLIFTSGIVLVAKFTPDDFIKGVNPLTWFWLVIFLFAICVFSLVYIIHKKEKCVFIKEFGIYQEKKTGNYICPSCKANGKKSHLKEYDTGWQCMTKDCYRIYYKAGKEPKTPARRVISKGIDNG